MAGSLASLTAVVLSVFFLGMATGLLVGHTDCPPVPPLATLIPPFESTPRP